MKTGIMQPYFVPYIGYWQLLNAVDQYVIYDDVNYINRGWINRNKILIDGNPGYFNIPMLGASQNKLINEIEVGINSKTIFKNLKMIEYSYKKAPFYSETYALLKKILYLEERNLASFLIESIKIICDHLDIKTKLIISSSLEKNCTLKGQDKILSICELLGTTEYYNPIGGKSLYSAYDFEKKGIKLYFLKTNTIEYKQFGEEFHPNLSIIDIMMFNPLEKIKEMLSMYILE